jgi:hypothetical protein
MLLAVILAGTASAGEAKQTSAWKMQRDAHKFMGTAADEATRRRSEEAESRSRPSAQQTMPPTPVADKNVAVFHDAKLFTLLAERYKTAVVIVEQTHGNIFVLFMQHPIIRFTTIVFIGLALAWCIVKWRG